MTYKCRFIVVFVLVLVARSSAPPAVGDAPSQEYRVKAAFLYNFMKFVDWPKEKMGDPNEPMSLGIVGKDPFGDAFDPVKDKKVKNRKIVIKRIRGISSLHEADDRRKAELERLVAAVRRCHIVFVCNSEQKHLAEILKSVGGYPVLTIGDCEGVLENGGIINFVMENQKVRFEVNATAARNAKIQIRSELLRLARRVIKGKHQSRR